MSVDIRLQLVCIAGKIFAGCYAIDCGLVFLFIAGLLVTPVAHRLLHLFHADPNEPGNSE